MLFIPFLLSLGSIAALVAGVQSLVTSPFSSFGGVNHQSLQFLDPVERDEVIGAAAKAGASVIRLFSQL